MVPVAGSPEQQMDLSLIHPYPGENKLIDRLLAIKEVNEQYRKLLKELAGTCFARERLLKDIDAMEKATKEILAREKKAVEARKEGAGGFRPPGGPGGSSPSLQVFVEKRTESVAAQLAGKSKGYIPPTGFGPGGGRPGKSLGEAAAGALDTDKDGKVTKEELLAGVKKFFKESDKRRRGIWTSRPLLPGSSTSCRFPRASALPAAPVVLGGVRAGPVGSGRETSWPGPLSGAPTPTRTAR